MAPRPGIRPSAVGGDSLGSRPPLLTVSGPSELAQAVPYLLGFHPRDSVVTVGLRRGRVVVTARVDLADVIDPAEPVSLPATLRAMTRSGVTRLVGLVYDDDAGGPAGAGGALPWAAVADAVSSAARQVGLDIGEIALVSGGRVWSYLCDDPRCCPPEGRPVETDSALAATATYAGLVALPDRTSLAALLARRSTRRSPSNAPPHSPPPNGPRSPAARSQRTESRALLGAARRFDRPGSTDLLGDDERARYAVALRRSEVRDTVWIGIDDGRADGRALWRQLATSLPAPWDAAPLFLFGWASYRAGDGALARIAADRALESDPGVLGRRHAARGARPGPGPAPAAQAASARWQGRRRAPAGRRRPVTEEPRGAAPGAADPTHR